jgi:predicted transcriptional regulator
MSYMRATLTISLPPALRRAVSRCAKDQGLTPSEFVRRAVQQQIWAAAFDESRRLLLPKARAKGIYTDDDVFELIS